VDRLEDSAAVCYGLSCREVDDVGKLRCSGRVIKIKRVFAAVDDDQRLIDCGKFVNEFGVSGTAGSNRKRYTFERSRPERGRKLEAE
jgi:hypothetical protein